MSDDQKHNAWNVVKASFWLLASIIWAQIFVGMFLVFACFWTIYTKQAPLGSCRDNAPNILELLVGGMAVVIAFSGRGNHNNG